MTAALILAALFLPAVGFIAGALWERRKQRQHSIEMQVDAALYRINMDVALRALRGQKSGSDRDQWRVS